jgi:flagellar motor protein MotB
MEYQPQVLVAVYEDGLLITIDGKSSFKQMTATQMLHMAQELIEKSVKDIRGKHYGTGTE